MTPLLREVVNAAVEGAALEGAVSQIQGAAAPPLVMAAEDAVGEGVVEDVAETKDTSDSRDE
jgi:hypothetical protein